MCRRGAEGMLCAAYGRQVTSSRLEPPRTPPAHTGRGAVRPTLRRSLRRGGRLHVTNRISMACSPTASPCSATTMPPPRRSAVCSRSRNGRTAGARRARRNVNPGCMHWPDGRVCASSPSRNRAVRRTATMPGSCREDGRPSRRRSARRSGRGRTSGQAAGRDGHPGGARGSPYVPGRRREGH